MDVRCTSIHTALKKVLSIHQNMDYFFILAPPLMRLWEFGRVDPKLEEPNVALMAGQMVVGAFFVTILFASLVLATLGTWPGHPGGKLYPLYVPEHYGKHSKKNRHHTYSNIIFCLK